MTIAERILEKKALPTAMDSREIRAKWSQRLREQALFSAQMTYRGYLERLQVILAEVAEGRLDASAARLALRAKLAEFGYESRRAERAADTPLSTPNSPHFLQDHASTQRLNLILKTNRQTAASMAQLAQSEDPVRLLRFPAWELVSGGYRHHHRTNWHLRWQAAGRAVGWQGAHRTRMAALKTSPIWKALGEGVGGFTDTLGNPYPPFAFNSSYEWSELSLLETQDLGLLPKASTLIANSQAHCPECGEWLRKDGSCSGCQGVEAALTRGNNPDPVKMQDAEVGKGKVALKKCIEEQVDIYDALARSDLGTISFIYGDERRGIAHFMPRKDTLDHLPQTLIYGKLGQPYQGGQKRNITHAGYTAALRLFRDGKEERWVITSFGPQDKK